MIKLQIPKELQKAVMLNVDKILIVPIFKDVKELIGKAHIKKDEQSKDYYAELLITKDAQEQYKIEESSTPFTIAAEIVDAKSINSQIIPETYKVKFLNI